MSRSDGRALVMAASLLAGMNSVAAPPWQALGAPLDAAAIASWDIDVRPDGQGLPHGQGSVAEGQVIYDAQCASCHGTFGESTDYLAIAGGIGSLATDSPQRTAGSKLAHATTLWDYINRAMPFGAPKSLSANEVYAVTAYVLNLNEIVPADAVLDEHTLPKVQMPNRDGFTEAHGLRTRDGAPDVHNTACMQDCGPAPTVTSALPDGFTAQMYGDVHRHFRAFAQGTTPPAESSPAGANAPVSLARASGCLGCHGLEQAVVGPAFADIGKRYAHDAGAVKALAAAVRQGGSGRWGAAAMPPQAALSDGQIATLVGWILAGAPP